MEDKRSRLRKERKHRFIIVPPLLQNVVTSGFLSRVISKSYLIFGRAGGFLPALCQALGVKNLGTCITVLLTRPHHTLGGAEVRHSPAIDAQVNKEKSYSADSTVDAYQEKVIEGQMK